MKDTRSLTRSSRRRKTFSVALLALFFALCTVSFFAANIPAFITDLAETTTTTNGDLTLEVAVESDSTASYQWQFCAADADPADEANWQNLVGEGYVTLALSGLGFFDNGKHYRVVATNDTGSAASTATTLTDIPRTPTTATLPNVTVLTAKTETVVLAPLVRFEFSGGGRNDSVDLRLFDADAPLSVANFLKYVRADGTAEPNYAGTVIHRNVSNFVVQGGGYSAASVAIGNYGTVANEAKRANTRGTIAYALTADDLGSATSQWFVNVADNSASLGDYTVFGEVISDGGLDFFDYVNALPTYDANSVVVSDGTPFNADGTFVTLEGAYELGASGYVLVSNSAPQFVSAEIVNGNQLRLTGASDKTGNAVVVVAAEGAGGRRALHTLNVKVIADPENLPPNAPIVSEPSVEPPTLFIFAPAVRTKAQQVFDAIRKYAPPAVPSVVSGQDVFFSVAAEGETLTYQWLKNGVAIEDATTPNLEATSIAAGDIYTVAVTNTAAGVTVEKTAPLPAVLGAPKVWVAPLFTVLEEVGGETTLRTNVSGLGANAYQWSVFDDYDDDGLPVWKDLEGATEATLTVREGGTYRIAVTDATGLTSYAGVSVLDTAIAPKTMPTEKTLALTSWIFTNDTFQLRTSDDGETLTAESYSALLTRTLATFYGLDALVFHPEGLQFKYTYTRRDIDPTYEGFGTYGDLNYEVACIEPYTGRAIYISGLIVLNFEDHYYAHGVTITDIETGHYYGTYDAGGDFTLE